MILPRRSVRRAWLAVALAAAGCAGPRSFALYPERPQPAAGAPLVEPAPSRVVLHATVARAALEHALDQAVPKSGTGSFPLLGSDRRYVWQREPFTVQFRQGRLIIDTKAKASVELPLVTQELNLDLHVETEPVVSAAYQAVLQSPEVRVTSPDTRLKLAQSLGGALDKIRDTLAGTLRDFKYDLRPILDETYERVARPIELPLGDARGCAQLQVLGVEAGPTVLADGIEKDLALVVAPSITLPCAGAGTPPPLPPLANVAMVPPGPFTVQIPIAARYEELERAMGLAFTNGRLYFSKDLPEVYLEQPGIYASRDQLVLKVHIAGHVKKGPVDANLDGDLYMVGHPTVVDNEIRVPDLEHTVETKSVLLKLATAMNGDSIRDAARDALHLDIGERMKAVRAKLSTELSFGEAAPGATSAGCVRASVTRFEVSNVYAHPSYLRLYLAVTGQASLYLPCPR